jgi:hypothetical protein
MNICSLPHTAHLWPFNGDMNVKGHQDTGLPFTSRAPSRGGWEQEPVNIYLRCFYFASPKVIGLGYAYSVQKNSDDGDCMRRQICFASLEVWRRENCKRIKYLCYFVLTGGGKWFELCHKYRNKILKLLETYSDSFEADSLLLSLRYFSRTKRSEAWSLYSKTRRVYCSEYTEIPKAFFTPQDGRWRQQVAPLIIRLKGTVNLDYSSSKDTTKATKVSKLIVVIMWSEFIAVSQQWPRLPLF